MASSWRVRPNQGEVQTAVVYVASFTNPATHVPDSAIAVVVGANIGKYRQTEIFNRARDCIETLKELHWQLPTATQYWKATVAIDGHKGGVVVTDVLGTDTASEDNITVYSGSDPNYPTSSHFLTVAGDHIISAMMADAVFKAA